MDDVLKDLSSWKTTKEKPIAVDKSKAILTKELDE